MSEASSSVVPASLQKDSELLELLMEYYKVLKQDMLLQMSSVKNHVRNSQIIGATLVALLTILLNTNNFSVTTNTVYLWVIAAFALNTLSYYLIYDVLEAVYAVKALESYLSTLETRINDLIGKRVLMWQSDIANTLWSMSYCIEKIVPPMRGLEFYQLIIVCGTAVVLPLFVYYQVWNVAYGNKALSVFLCFFVFYSLFSAIMVVYVWSGVNRRLSAGVQRMIHDSLSTQI
jgi:hypothetical protein